MLRSYICRVYTCALLALITDPERSKTVLLHPHRRSRRFFSLYLANKYYRVNTVNGTSFVTKLIAIVHNESLWLSTYSSGLTECRGHMRLTT
jgi:hypothetical protein